MVEERYSRQALFAEIGPEGQRALSAGSALLVGCGALGALAAEWLVRAGLGRLRIVDRDCVEWSNLHRQVLYDEQDAALAQPKAVAAAEKLRRINSGVQVEGMVEDVTARSLPALASGCGLVVDGTDNFETRYLLNDFCVREDLPWIYGAAVGSYGLTMTVLPGEGPCLRCLFDSAPPPASTPTCETAGVLGPVVGVVASLQAAEAMKLLSGRRAAVRTDLLAVDVWSGRVSQMRAERRAGPPDPCPACALRRFDFLEGAAGSATTVLCGRESVQVTPASASGVELAALAGRLAPLGEVTSNSFLVRVRIGAHTLTVFADGRAIISGTRDPAAARSLYARYVGS